MPFFATPAEAAGSAGKTRAGAVTIIIIIITIITRGRTQLLLLLPGELVRRY